jgi:3-hydroxybutyryl-CoA dehydrogenase
MTDSMTLEKIQKVAVIGAGIMGAQITQLFAQIGKYPVMLTSTSIASVNNKGLKTIRENLQKYYVDKGRMNPTEMSEIYGRITGTAILAEAVGDADLVVEAVYEDLALKKNIFKQLGEQCPPRTIMVTSTSDFNITEIGSVTLRPQKVVGMHFFHPVTASKAIEVVRGSLTSDETIETAVTLTKKLGKEPLMCKDFSYGFLANRAYTPMVLEAVQMVWERVAPPSEIDKALKLGYGLPIGPLELFDLLGIWKIQASAEEDKIKELGEKGRLHPLIRMMDRAGYTGGPGKKGIYAFFKEVLEPNSK